MPIDIRRRLKAAEKRLQADLEEARASFEHAGNKGTTVEKAFRSFLSQNLPRRFDVGEGEIIDSFGGSAGSMVRPGQIDVVIVNDLHPRTFSEDRPGLFFVEGVVAAGEIKSVLTSDELTLSLKKAVAIKSLRPDNSGLSISTTRESDRQRFIERRAFFLFAFESRISLEKIHEVIVSFANDNQYHPLLLIDAVCCLDRGTLINLFDGTGKLRVESKKDDKVVRQWIAWPNKPPLLVLLSWLNVIMPMDVRFDNFMIKYLNPD